MEEIKTMREELGLSQEQMAGLLSVERGQLSMEEINKRSLPTKAVIRWNLLYKAFEAGNLPMGTKAMAALQPTDKEKKSIQRKLSKCQMVLNQLRLQLEGVAKKYGQCEKALQAVTFLWTEPPKIKLSELDIASLNYVEHVKVLQLKKYSTTAQMQLRIKIGKLELEEKELGEWLDTYQG